MTRSDHVARKFPPGSQALQKAPPLLQEGSPCSLSPLPESSRGSPYLEHFKICCLKSFFHARAGPGTGRLIVGEDNYIWRRG